ncbi:hypothetical protein DRB17_05750 [Ferruginivarius sediminum]|uniref:Uncharacterized protein n=1 Tax=Ferruginivarius sediminum TaxID=2661937 RepID=A0A369TE71_9PROT|nr:hypothetical protein DRB17_05750 [Ferruginivarius sediminum]
MAGTAVLGVLGYAGAVQADVFVNATIDKVKTVNVNETINVDKFVNIDAFVDNNALKAAESLALVNQRNEDNEACTNCAEKQDIINDSFNTNSGLVTWNQAAGNMNNQANAISASVDNFVPGDGDDGGDPESEPTGFAEAQASAEQINGDRDGEGGANTVDSVNILFRDARLIASGNGNSGVLFLNQSAGNMNNQVNELSLAVAFADEGVALSEADLGQWTTGNFVGESDGSVPGGDPAGDGINKAATINGSLNGNAGVIGVNQSVGNLANQGNVFSLAGVQPVNGG